MRADLVHHGPRHLHRHGHDHDLRLPHSLGPIPAVVKLQHVDMVAAGGEFSAQQPTHPTVPAHNQEAPRHFGRHRHRRLARHLLLDPVRALDQRLHELMGKLRRQADLHRYRVRSLIDPPLAVAIKQRPATSRPCLGGRNAMHDLVAPRRRCQHTPVELIQLRTQAGQFITLLGHGCCPFLSGVLVGSSTTWGSV